jgi:hypothetical protein
MVILTSGLWLVFLTPYLLYKSKKRPNSLKFTDFPEQQFRAGIKRILWKEEGLKAEGFLR